MNNRDPLAMLYLRRCAWHIVKVPNVPSQKGSADLAPHPKTLKVGLMWPNLCGMGVPELNGKAILERLVRACADDNASGRKLVVDQLCFGHDQGSAERTAQLRTAVGEAMALWDETHGDTVLSDVLAVLRRVTSPPANVAGMPASAASKAAACAADQAAAQAALVGLMTRPAATTPAAGVIMEVVDALIDLTGRAWSDEEVIDSYWKALPTGDLRIGMAVRMMKADRWTLMKVVDGWYDGEFSLASENSADGGLARLLAKHAEPSLLARQVPTLRLSVEGSGSDLFHYLFLADGAPFAIAAVQLRLGRFVQFDHVILDQAHLNEGLRSGRLMSVIDSSVPKIDPQMQCYQNPTDFDALRDALEEAARQTANRIAKPGHGDDDGR